MKLAKLAMALFTITLFTACSNDSSDNKSEETSTEVEQEIEKENESVQLPVTIFSEENYYEGQDVTFHRSIDSVNVSDFTDSNELDFLDRYGNEINRLNLDLANDYKLVEISMSHTLDGETDKSKRLEAFILNENSEILYNNETITDEVVTHQLSQATRDYSMGTNHDETGNILLAIPNEYFNNGHLQLKTVQENNDANEFIYIDLK